MARTQSPTCALSELPSLIVGSGSFVSILITAMSVSLSMPMMRAGRPSSPAPSGSVESLTKILSALSTTWLLVMM